MSQLSAVACSRQWLSGLPFVRERGVGTLRFLFTTKCICALTDSLMV